MTRFIHIGDFHAGPGSRNADRYRALEQIQAAGESMSDLGAWLWPGDLNDSRMTIEDRNRLAEALLDMARIAPVIICYGNHDLPGDLDVFAHLKGKYAIYVIDRPHVQILQLATGETAAIFVLPYPQKAGLVAAGVAAGDVVPAAGDLLEPIFMQAAAQLEECRAAGYLTLMIGHVNIAGAIASTGQPNIGHEIELNPRHLERLGPIYKGLNHIHKPQALAGAHYAGSVCRLDYGEIEEKRYLVVSAFANANSPIGISYHLESQPLAIAPMFHVDCRLDRDGVALPFDTDDEIARRCGNQDWTGCDVRCRYSYQASERAVINEQHIRDMFAGALRLKIEGVAIADRELRAPEVAAAKTLPAKLAAYRKVEHLEPSVSQKLALLQNADVAGVLADVALKLQEIESPEKARVAA